MLYIGLILTYYLPETRVKAGSGPWDQCTGSENRPWSHYLSPGRPARHNWLLVTPRRWRDFKLSWARNKELTAEVRATMVTLY